MATWHKFLVDNGTLKADKKLQAELEGKVEKKLKEFDEKIEVCEKEEGDVDVRDAMVDRAEYLAKTGDRVNAIKGFAQIRKKVSHDHRHQTRPDLQPAETRPILQR